MRTRITKLIGQTLQTTTTFEDFHAHKITPPVVTLKYKNSTGTVTETITPDSDGKYSKALLLDVSGDWVFRWECNGSYANAKEFIVTVEPSLI